MDTVRKTLGVLATTLMVVLIPSAARAEPTPGPSASLDPAAPAPAAVPAGNSFDTTLKDAAGSLADSLSSLLKSAFTELSHIASPDVSSGGFATTYAAGAGIAIFVLVVVLARMFYRTSSGEMSGEALAESLWRWVPTAMMLVVFGPGLGYLLVQLMDAASKSIVSYFGTELGALSGKLTSMVVLGDTEKVPGGPIVALLVMAIAFCGVLGIVGGLLAQTLALYLTGAVMAIAFVGLIDPQSRGKALRLPVAWIGLLLAKPLLFFLIGVVARIADSAFTMKSIADPGWRVLVTALLASFALLMAGLAPWSLLKFGPALPAGRDRSARRSRSGGIAAAQPGSQTMMQMSYRRLEGLPGMSGQPGGVPSTWRTGAAPPPPLPANYGGTHRHRLIRAERGTDTPIRTRGEAVDPAATDETLSTQAVETLKRRAPGTVGDTYADNDPDRSWP